MRSAFERFDDKWRLDDSTGCHVWTASVQSSGYGQFRWKGGGKEVGLAHRFAYEAKVGRVPIGLELDHLCLNRRCVNPAHLEPVTHLENMRRRSARPAP